MAIICVAVCSHFVAANKFWTSILNSLVRKRHNFSLFSIRCDSKNGFNWMFIKRIWIGAQKKRYVAGVGKCVNWKSRNSSSTNNNETKRKTKENSNRRLSSISVRMTLRFNIQMNRNTSSSNRHLSLVVHSIQNHKCNFEINT